MGLWDDVKNFAGGVASNPIVQGGAALFGGGALGPLGQGLGLYGAANNAGVLPGGGAEGPAFGRGQPGSGTAPDKASFTLNWDPSGVQGVAQQAAGIGQQAQAGGQNIMGQAQGHTDTGARYGQQAGALPFRQTPGINQAAALGALGQAGNISGQQGGIAGQLAGQAGRETGSGAQAMLAQGTNDALASQLALARSGSGFGGSAATQGQAMLAAPEAIARGANQAAIMQAQTDQTDAARDLQALEAAGGQYGSQRGQDIQSAGLYGSLAGQSAAQQLAGLQANDAQQLGLGQLGLGFAGLGQQGGLAGLNASLEGQLGAGQLGLGAEQLGLRGAESSLAGLSDYERALSDLYGIDANYRLGSRELGQQASRDRVQGVLGGIEAVGSFFG